MSDDYTEFDFTGSMGSDAARDASKQGGSFAREIEYMNLKTDEVSRRQGKDQMLVRFLTDYALPAEAVGKPVDRYTLPWITVDQHYCPTKPRPSYLREGATWPEKWNAVCREDRIFAAKYNGCLLCERKEKASPRSWALGIEREQVKDDSGRVIGIRDKTRELPTFGPDNKPIEGQERLVPAFVVMNYGWRNFFGNLDGQARYFQTVLDTDYLVVRTGTQGGTDTNYTFVRLDPSPVGENPWGLDPSAPYNLSDRDLMRVVYPEMPDLRKVIAEKTTDDYYGHWFTPGWAPQGQQGQQQAPQAPQGQQHPATQQQPQVPQTQQAASSEPPSDALAALRARIGVSGS